MLRVAFLVFTFISFGVSAEGGSTPISIAKEDLVRSLEAMANKEAECKVSETKLTKENFDGIDASDEDMKIAISYYYYKSRMDCIGLEASDVVTKLAVLNRLQDATKKEGNAASMLVISDLVRVIELEAQYEGLNKQLKTKLSLISELRKPFNMASAIHVLGL